MLKRMWCILGIEGNRVLAIFLNTLMCNSRPLIGINTLAIIIDSRTIQYGSNLLETQTANNSIIQEFLLSISERVSSSGLTVSESFAVSKVYLKDILLLKAQELAFQDGYIALAMLFLIGMFATMILFRKTS